MFSVETTALIPAFKARKLAQWERVKDTLAGLQLAQAGEGGCEFMLTCSPHDGQFYESVVFGALPQIVLEPYGSPARPKYRDAPEAKKPIDKRGVDLSDDQIDTILALWGKGQSSFALDFVASVWGPGGKRHVKS